MFSVQKSMRNDYSEIVQIEIEIAPVGKSYSALDFQADVVVCINEGI